MVYGGHFHRAFLDDGEGRDLIKETDERKRRRKRERALSRAFRTHVLRRMLHASISGTIALKGFRCLLPSLPPSERGAILVSTSNASRRHSCTPLSPRINDPPSVFSTRTATISGRGQLRNSFGI